MSEIDDTSDSPGSIDSDDSVVDYSHKKRRILILLLACSALFGIISVFLPEEDTVLNYVVGLPLLFLAVVWCHTDADEREHRMGRMMFFSLLLVFVLAFPIYVIHTRGLHGLKTLLLAAIFVAAMATCMLAAGLATIYIGFSLGLVE